MKQKLLIGVYILMTAPLFSQNGFLELNLNKHAMRNIMSPGQNRISLDIFKVIERAEKDKNIGGILLNISSCSLGQEALWELRIALEKFRATGKKVLAFISNVGMDLYCLATVADKIIMDDQGILMMPGYVWGRPFVKQGLEKLGIGVRELRYFEYKSAAETYTRESLSDADRLQYGEILDEVMSVTFEAITKARSLTSDELNAIIDNEFMFSARSALERGLVDYTGRKETVMQTAKELYGGKKKINFYLYGEAASSLSGSKKTYTPLRSGGFLSRPPIVAVIYVKGVTDMEHGIAAWNLSNLIKELSEINRVKALVLRVNSPGGSAEAADYVNEAIIKAKERIPVVVSMGSVAASGGYWMSMSANHITASPYTLTGSIGVIGSWFFDNGLNNKLGLTTDLIQRGNHADMTAGIIFPARDLKPLEEERYKEYILDLYADFTSRVAKSRNMDIEQVEAIAQGRVYSGIGAYKAGLVDSIGGLNDAINTARKLANIPEKKKVLYDVYPKPKFMNRMISRLLRSQSYINDSLIVPILPPIAAHLLEEIKYRITNNGRVMPILPIDSGFGHTGD